MLYLITILFPILSGITVSVALNDDRETDTEIKQKRMRLRNRWYAAIMLITDLLAVLLMTGPENGPSLLVVENAGIFFGLDGFGRFMLSVILILYTLVCFYGFAYMDREERHEYFYAFFFLSLGALIAVCASNTLVTMYCFFELATLSSMPLVLHERNKESVAAGRKYLFYSIAGAILGLGAILMVYSTGQMNVAFVLGGFLSPSDLQGREGLFLAAIFLGIVGFGTKAGIYPMHGWLPEAHPIAPAPASALMSGVIAKAGIIAIVRLVYYSVGPDLLRGTWVQRAWMILAMITILLGSSMAFFEPVLKKRLAYSTVSQISYILLGLSCLSSQGLGGGLLQVASHAASKGCLFLCAGAIIYLTAKHDVKELSGIGKQLPLTMACFMAASLSLVGIPPMGGFLAKWNLGLALLSSQEGIWAYLPVVVLLISAMLTAGYLFPVVIGGFVPVKGRGVRKHDEKPQAGSEEKAGGKIREPLLFVLPMILLCMIALLVGLFGSRMLPYFVF